MRSCFIITSTYSLLILWYNCCTCCRLVLSCGFPVDTNPVACPSAPGVGRLSCWSFCNFARGWSWLLFGWCDSQRILWVRSQSGRWNAAIFAFRPVLRMLIDVFIFIITLQIKHWLARHWCISCWAWKQPESSSQGSTHCRRWRRCSRWRIWQCRRRTHWKFSNVNYVGEKVTYCSEIN